MARSIVDRGLLSREQGSMLEHAQITEETVMLDVVSSHCDSNITLRSGSSSSDSYLDSSRDVMTEVVVEEKMIESDKKGQFNLVKKPMCLCHIILHFLQKNDFKISIKKCV